MKLDLEFKGRSDPFEGDRTLHLKSIPEGAQITSAQVKIKPQQCVEKISFRNGVGNWGATKESGASDSLDVNVGNGETQPVNWVVVDFHVRRRLTQIRARASGNNGPIGVQVDVGGLWVRLAGDGTISSEERADVFKITLEEIFRTKDLIPITVQGVKLQHESSEVEISQVTISSYPSNLSLSLGQSVPFWARPGELSKDEISSEFAEILQAFLTEAEVVNGFYDVPLVVHSDTIACLDLTVTIEYVVEKSALLSGVTEMTLPFKHNGLSEMAGGMLQLQLPVGARVVPGKTSAQVVGAFQDSRVVHGPTGKVDIVDGVTVSTTLSQAHPILLDEDTPAMAVDLLLAAGPESPTVVLALSLQEDTDGKPGPKTLLAAPVMISLDRDIVGTPTWISAALPAEFQFKKGTRYWLALQAQSGQAHWSVNTEAADVGMHFTDNGGLSWRQTVVPAVNESVAGLFRLRHVPPTFRMPIELYVGEGDAAIPVSLERFAPMRRVDFNLNFNEVAEAINHYVEASGPAACSEGEQLVNGNFSEWTVVGDNILTPHSSHLDGTPLVVAVSPDDCWIYVAGGKNFRFIDALCNTEVDAFELEVGRAIDIAIHPNGKYVYLLTARFGEGVSRDLLLIDTISRRLIGNSIQIDVGSEKIVLSPDGRRLDVLGTTTKSSNLKGWVQTLDTEEILEATVLDQPDVTSLSVEEIDLGPDRLPTEAVVTQKGNMLLVAVRNDIDGRGEIHIINTTTGDLDVIPIAESRSLTGISAVPGEDMVVVTDAFVSEGPISRKVFLVDFVNKTIDQINGNPELSTEKEPWLGNFSFPSDVVAPDGKRAFIIDLGNHCVLIIDIARLSVTHAFPLKTRPRDIAISKQGDCVYIPITNFEGYSFLVSIAIGHLFPEEWTLTSGRLSHFCLSDPFHRAVVLGFDPISGELEQPPTSISQVIPVTPVGLYEFAFWGRVMGNEAVAEVLWLGDECGLLQADVVPIELFDPETVEAVLIPPEILLHRARLTSPAAATQAEIRFTVKGGGIAVVDEVSFQATQDAVFNRDFHFRPDEELAAWALSPEDATGLLLDTVDGEVVLSNTGESPFTLSQTIAVTAEKQFTLKFQGRATAVSPTQSPQIELRWLTADEAKAADATILKIDPSGPDTQFSSGTVPAKAIEAELRLVLPVGATLMVSNVSFQPVELVHVPLTFIALAPGELSISDFTVAFDISAVPSLPPIPETGLCTPTPPGQEPGSQPSGCCYCPCCQDDKCVDDPEPVKTAVGRPATRINCPDCSATLIQPGGNLTTERTTPRAISARPATRRIMATRPRAGQPVVASIAIDPPPILPMEDEIKSILPITPTEIADLAEKPRELAMPPLETIDGIGPKRTEQLGELGIKSIAALAKADSEEIAIRLKGVSVDMASHFISEAKAKIVSFEAEHK